MHRARDAIFHRWEEQLDNKRGLYGGGGGGWDGSRPRLFEKHAEAYMPIEMHSCLNACNFVKNQQFPYVPTTSVYKSKPLRLSYSACRTIPLMPKQNGTSTIYVWFLPQERKKQTKILFFF